MFQIESPGRTSVKSGHLSKIIDKERGFTKNDATDLISTNHVASDDYVFGGCLRRAAAGSSIDPKIRASAEIDQQIGQRDRFSPQRKNKFFGTHMVYQG
jgi:hypothetical protein